MDLNHEDSYERLARETKVAYGKLKMYRFEQSDVGVMAAILVASEHSNEDLGQLAGFVHENTKVKTLGQKFKEYRTKLGLTQTEFADQLNISRPYMSEIEHDKRSMSVQTVRILVDRLGISMSDFFN